MKKRVLFLQGLGADRMKNRLIDKVLEEELGDLCTLKIIAPNYEYPQKVYEELVRISSSFDIIIGFSMGGFFADLLPIPIKVYINPALTIPEVIPEKKRNQSAGIELKELSAQKFKYKPKEVISFHGSADKLLGLKPAELIKKHYPNSKINIIEGGTHILTEEDWVNIAYKIKELL